MASAGAGVSRRPLHAVVSRDHSEVLGYDFKSTTHEAERECNQRIEATDLAQEWVLNTFVVLDVPLRLLRVDLLQDTA